MKRKLIIAGTVLGLCLGVVVTRAFYDGGRALSRAKAAESAGELDDAVRWYRRAARWYVPGAPHVSDAYDALERVARQAEEDDNPMLALDAWRGVRNSVLATRSFYVPFEERLEPANRRIAALMARVEGAEADPGKTEAEREQWHYELLERDDAPSVFWSLVALLGFAGWLGGGFLFAFRGVTADDRLDARPAAASGVLVAVGLVVWMLGLYYA